MTIDNHFSVGDILKPKSLQPSLHGPRAATVHLIKDEPDEPIPTKANPMNEKETRTLGAIKAHSPINRTDLEAATNLSGQPLSVVLHALKKGKHIVALPNQRYAVPGIGVYAPALSPTPKKPTPAKKAATPKTGTFAARIARATSDSNDPEPDTEYRAATMSDGRVVIIEGATVVATLSAAQAACVKAL